MKQTISDKTGGMVRLMLSGLLLILVFGLKFSAHEVYAVPAMPGSGYAEDAGFCPSHAGDLVTLDDIPAGRPSAAGRKKVKSIGRTDKNIPLAVIVVGFNNIQYDDSYNWYDTIFAGNESLQAYYRDMSFGRFTFEPAAETSAYNDGSGNTTNVSDTVNDGIIHVSLDLAHECWSGLVASGEVNSLRNTLAAAIEAADPYIDFSAYDSDHDGKIERETGELALCFVFAGYEAAADKYLTNGSENYIWSHSWSFDEIKTDYHLTTEAPSPDGAELNDYVVIAEHLNKNSQELIGIPVHELGHYLGLPDLYDTESYDKSDLSSDQNWTAYDVGYLSVMANGSWGRTSSGGYIPTSMDIWSRVALGWVEPAEISCGSNGVTAQDYDSGSGYQALKISTGRDSEYYLVENRQDNKWDQRLYASVKVSENSPKGGLILWHIDEAVLNQYLENNSVNDGNHRPAVMPLYPETGESGVTWTGNEPDLKSPFYDAAVWSSKYASSVGAELNLPLYGTDDSANLRSARTSSDIKIQFTDNNASTMHVNLSHLYGKWKKLSATQHQRVCSRNHAHIEKASHTWDAGVITTKATANADGIRTYTCTACGAVKTEKISRTGSSDNTQEAKEGSQESGSQSGTSGVSSQSGTSTTAKSTKTIPSVLPSSGAEKYAGLLLQSKSQTKTSIRLNWKKIPGAAKYVIYGNRCGTAYTAKKLKTTTKTAYTVKTIGGKKLKKGTYYKFVVIAFDARNRQLSRSVMIHIVTKGGTCANDTKVTTKAKNGAVSLKAGKKFSLSGTSRAIGGRKVSRHRGVCYESTDKKIATVSKKGVIRAKKKGTCYIYVYAQCGASKRIRVTVR
ncbi:MAG: M6 family metalloprotease domain-containing protein [Eubacterium sp.]|nr:M6 family metalloprotease domain-containing protein [Eubacterium sp.]